MTDVPGTDVPGTDLASGDRRVLTVPNGITLVRLALLPVFLWLLLVAERRQPAAFLLAFLGSTDWVDGWVARRFHQVSAVGKVLDPVADRVVLIAAVVAILVDGSAPLWVGMAALVREALVSAGTVAVAALGGRRVDVQTAGKAGTLLLYFAFPLFLASRADLGAPDAWRAAAWVAAVPGILLSWYALVTYVPMAKQALAEGRAPR